MNELVIDLTSLTIGDLEDAEEIVGEPISGNLENMPARVLKALAYVVGRKSDPDFSLDDARAVQLSALSAEVDPTEPPA